jgi:hypothetical protein
MNKTYQTIPIASLQCRGGKNQSSLFGQPSAGSGWKQAFKTPQVWAVE